MKRIGSRAQVYHKNAIQTSGGLKRKDLFKDKHGCIKSKKASTRAKKNKNLGKLLKQKGSGCFDYSKKIKTQLGGGKNKKNVELEKHIFIFSEGMMPTFTLPNHYKNAKLNYKCNCPFSKLIKHNIEDHIENDNMKMFEDKEMGFLLPEKCHLSKKELNKNCKCNYLKNIHKVIEHQISKKNKKINKKNKKNKKGGGLGSLFGKLAAKAQTVGPAFNKLASKGTAIAQKAAVQGQMLADKAKKINIEGAINKIENVGNKIDQASQVVDTLSQQGQQVVGQVNQLSDQVGQVGTQLLTIPQQIKVPQIQIPQYTQPQQYITQPQLLQQPQPQQYITKPRYTIPQIPIVRGGKKKKSKK